MKKERIPVAVWWLLALFVALTLLAVVWGVPTEERDLELRAAAAAADSGITVRLEGRDAVLIGSTDAVSADRVAVLVRAIRGVRVVDDRIQRTTATPSAPGPADGRPPEVTMALRDGTIEIAGVVPSQAAADQIVAAAVERFGVTNVVNALVVAQSTSPDWLVAVPTLLTEVELAEGIIALRETGASVAGTVPSEEAKEAVGRQVVDLTGLPVDNRLDVVPLDSVVFRAVKSDDGVVTLSGALPDQEAVDRIVGRAVEIYGEDSVVSTVSVGNVASPDWLEALPGIFPATVGLDPWSVDVANNVLTLEGRGPDDGTLGSASTAFGAIGETTSLNVVTKLEIDSESVAAELTELLRGSTTFQVGSADLAPEATTLLDQAIAILLANPSTTLLVAGHTDDVGDDAANLALSEARAQVVVDYFVAGGVEASRLSAIGLGETDPIADNGTEEGRAQNRRIEFVVNEGDG
ncbi:MAG TPA: OmpA family protein [Acidimicrobiia bacterium]|jgi:OOP family OmpA-OmpF porin